MITPLRDRDTLDVAGLERLVEHILAGGVHGLFILGTSGEAPSLSYRLRRELIERVCRQVRNRVPGMKDVPCVSLPAGEPSIYRLRSEAHPFGLATVEAIGRCLRVLEGERGPEVEQALLHVFRAMVERTLWSRGDFATADVTGGIPEGALRHDPRSGTS